MRGAGYKAIASATGLSRDIVRNYCKSQIGRASCRERVYREV